MRGVGTNQVITIGSGALPPARVLDLTRLISRAGRVLTGVDRVEFAYLRALISDPIPVFGLVRTAFGFALLNQQGCQKIYDRFGVEVWGKPDLLAHMSLKMPMLKKRGEADVRRFAIARCRPKGLSRMLAHVPQGATYLNVGHSNLTTCMLGAAKAAGLQVTVLIHDTIPLDYPVYQRAGTVEAFAGKLRRAMHHADMMIYNSTQSQRDSERHAAAWGQIPTGIVAHLGIELATPKPEDLPIGLDLKQPYFVIVSTIEPRKNHALLLDVWEKLDGPHLFVCGSRGWNNDAVFARLDQKPKGVTELAGLSDGAIAALVQGACGSLFPSFAEGYGLPPIEAAALGTPTVCGNLDIYKEVMGETPIYAEVNDRYHWERIIKDLSEGRHTPQTDGYEPPTWVAHFNHVLSVV